MNYGPSKKPKEIDAAVSYFLPHLIWVQYLVSHYDSNRNWDPDFTSQYLRLLEITVSNKITPSNHPLCRLCYLKLWSLFRKVLTDSKLKDWYRDINLNNRIYELLLNTLAMLTRYGFVLVIYLIIVVGMLTTTNLLPEILKQC